MSVSHLTALENAVIASILEGLPKVKDCLTEQVRQCQLQSRDHNGYGFFTNFKMPASVPVCLEANGTHSASALVCGELCGFLLWVIDGMIDFLEGYPLGCDSWPLDEVFEIVDLNSSDTKQ